MLELSEHRMLKHCSSMVLGHCSSYALRTYGRTHVTTTHLLEGSHVSNARRGVAKIA